MTIALLTIGSILAVLALAVLTISVWDYLTRRRIKMQIRELRRLLYEADDDEGTRRAGSLW